MKHPLAIAVQNGFTAALGAQVNDGDMSFTQAKQITTFAMAITREYLKGNKMFGKSLTDFAQDGQMWDDYLTSDKVNLPKLGGET